MCQRYNSILVSRVSCPQVILAQYVQGIIMSHVPKVFLNPSSAGLLSAGQVCCEVRKPPRRWLFLESSFLACAQVYCEVSTRQVLTTEYITGLTIDRCVDLPQTTRNHIAESILKLVFRSVY